MLVNLYEDMSLTRPSKQCKFLIDVLIQRQYLEKETFFCGGDEQWRRKISFCGEDEEKGRRKSRKIFGEGEYLVHGGEEDRRRKKRNHLEKEN